MAKHHSPRRQTIHSNTYRFFVSGSAIQGNDVQIADAELAHQMTNVLRLGIGDEVVLLDNSGWQFTVALTELGRASLRGSVKQREVVVGEPLIDLTLYAALIRPERFEWLLQKGTELGVSCFVPLISEYTTISDLSERKRERWQKIIREAAEQSRRGKLPQLDTAQSFDNACQQAVHHGPALLLWEGGAVESLRQALMRLHATSSANPASMSIMSGPEGGFAQSERETAQAYGLIPVSLGPRTLRAETAPIAAVTAILYTFGELE